METNEPIHIISLGAGVQSSTMALMAAKGEITPMPKCAIFADTQAEPTSVYTWLDWLEKQLPFPVHRVTAGSLVDDSVRVIASKRTPGNIYFKGGIPAFVLSSSGKKGLLGRKCTTDFKVVPMHKFMKSQFNIPRGCKDIRIIQWMGISLDEALRMKDSREPWIMKIYPLVDRSITRSECLKWMKANSYPVPPKSSCHGCPFHSDAEWLRLKNMESEDFEKAAQWEDKLQDAARRNNVLHGIPFLHSSCKPIRQVDFMELKPGHSQLDLFGNECTGLCGV